ncbi:ATP-binding cassette domain-containing protein [Lampropedia puyangensis]|uniref:ATP-binding cassette domain-containing protein n=1 Tax=Lampropedia puyangensis TaxID=1330072 RepID=A0A4S8F835_9BURK|nr:ATP-binding cassette domain-containing protein [Lampropedia puyangensis]THU03670.1 ATP-binding cassette domain-containing protein [Lampropedia puyangensis]
MGALLTLHGLNAWYGPKQVLFDVSMSLPLYGCTALVGPCGTGKSTLLQCVDSFSRTSQTQLSDGDWLARLTSWDVTAPISVAIAQQKQMRPDGTVLQFFCQEQLNSAGQVMQSLRELFNALHMADLLPLLLREASAVSDGEWALFNVLRAAYLGQAMVLLDEPTADLDQAEVVRMQALIKMLSQIRSVVFITHHLGHARALAEQVVLIGNGRVLASHPATLFFDTPSSDVVRHFLQFGTLAEERSQVVPRESACTSDLFASALAELTAGRIPRAGVLHPLLPSRFRWVVADRLAGVSIPGLLNDAHQDLQGLQGVGIDTLLNLTEVPFDGALLAQYGIKGLFVPIPDMEAPSVEQALGLCELLDVQLAQQAHLAVHCKAGQGRTGTVLALYLMWRSKGAWTAAQAIAAMRRIDSGWIQSERQLLFLGEFQQFIVNNVTFTE